MINIIEILEKYDSIGEVAKKIKGYSNGKVNKEVKKYIIKYGYEYKFLYSSKEKYNMNPKKCKNCYNIIPFDKKYNNFCSISCSSTYNNKKRDNFSEKTKEKISLSLKSKKRGGNRILKEYKKKCLYCNNYFVVDRRLNGRLSTKKYCSEKCSKSGMKLNVSKSQKERVKKGLHKGWQSRNIESYPETFFKSVLENNNIKYEFNKIISKRSLGLDCDANYFLDFFITDKNIDLEIDGKQHKYDDRIVSDELRDSSLIKNGFIVYRIKWKSINKKSGKEYIKKEINKFLEFYKNIR